ncbi:UNVERIFIED_CONTAM: hypothetical protein Sradi_3545700 [Sesamum radiatum]|uniref:Retrotransposon gag domain-containing protein n=1 Tax=Sesamum radiatum TaxID=300843 RepID=A0AAW2QG12_SESRA
MHASIGAVCGNLSSRPVREQVAALAPVRIATPSDVEVPEDEPGEVVPAPASPTIRRSDIHSLVPQEFPANWLARLECLQKGIQDVQYQIGRAPEEERQGVPFTELVMADDLPINCRTPAIAEYDGTTDPMEHLAHFENKDNEPLKEYLQRFNTVALEVPSATQKVKASAFSQGLLDGDSFKSLAKKPVPEFDALLARAAKYINMKDTQAAKNESRGEKMKDAKEETPSKKPRADSRERKVPYQRINAVYTPLTVPITQALMAVEGKGLLARPRSWRHGPQ